MKNLTAILFLALLFIAQSTQAWSGAGHQVIAAEAYRQLFPTLRTKVSEILKAHPDYEKWKESFAGDSANMDLGTFIFLRASTWSDDIRRRKSEYNHPKWHYVEDSVSMLPLLRGQEPKSPLREALVHESDQGWLAPPKANGNSVSVRAPAVGAFPNPARNATACRRSNCSISPPIRRRKPTGRRRIPKPFSNSAASCAPTLNWAVVQPARRRQTHRPPVGRRQRG